MSEQIERIASSVRRILERDSSGANDFVGLVISGEQLRRAVYISDPSAKDRTTLKEYDEFLRNYKGEQPDEIEEAIKGDLEELEEYAASPRRTRDFADGKNILLGLEETLSVVAAGFRAGFFKESEVKRLGERVFDQVEPLAARCFELAQFAEDRRLLFGADPVFSNLYDFWESFAEISYSRISLRAAVISMARRDRLVNKAVRKFEENNAKKGGQQ